MLAFLAVVALYALSGTTAEPAMLSCTDEYGMQFAQLMGWIQTVCVTQLQEQTKPDGTLATLGSCSHPECARLVGRVADGCHEFLSGGFGGAMASAFRPVRDLCVEGTRVDPAHDPPAPPVYAITDTVARGGFGRENPINTCAGSLTDGFDQIAPSASHPAFYAVLQPPAGQRLRLTATEMYLAKGNLRVGHGTIAAAEANNWEVGTPWRGTDVDAAGHSYAGTVGEPVRAMLAIDAQDATGPNSFNLAISCECVEPDSCGAHGQCHDGVCECSGGYQLLNGTCDDASCVGIDCSGEQHGQCFQGACLCRPGWVDDKCSTPDPCAPVDCKNGGTCEAQGSDATCRCATGFMGERCEERDPCAGVWCSSHGECVRGKCECHDGYFGDTCMDDCGALAAKNKGILRTNSNHVAATGCTAGYDTCLLETCDEAIQGCTLKRNGVGGLPFACNVNGIGAECKSDLLVILLSRSSRLGAVKTVGLTKFALSRLCCFHGMTLLSMRCSVHKLCGAQAFVLLRYTLATSCTRTVSLGVGVVGTGPRSIKAGRGVRAQADGAALAARNRHRRRAVVPVVAIELQ